MAEKTINGVKYRLGTVSAMLAIPLLAEIIAAAGPLAPHLPVIVAANQDEAAEGKLFGDAAFLTAISGIMLQMGPMGFTDLLRRIVELAEIQRPSDEAIGSYSPIIFDGDFTENLSDILPVARWVLGSTYGDFFTGGAGIGLLEMFKAGFLPRE